MKRSVSHELARPCSLPALDHEIDVDRKVLDLDILRHVDGAHPKVSSPYRTGIVRKRLRSKCRRRLREHLAHIRQISLKNLLDYLLSMLGQIARCTPESACIHEIGKHPLQGRYINSPSLTDDLVSGMRSHIIYFIGEPLDMYENLSTSDAFLLSVSTVCLSDK
ncbi:hypothetical protein B1M_12985 [Burkholderia sp. TJI49]|nr:hypothetical protein B1M_12985 [Burkholderia sp. TJI49]